MKHNLLIIAAGFTLLSCSKKSGTDPFNKDNLTTGKWKMTGLMRDYNKDGVYEEDTYSMYDPCLKDDVYTFRADGTLITDADALKCYPNDPQTITSTWSLTDNQTRIQVAGSTYQIEELSTSTFRLKARISYNVIYTIDQEVTYSKQ